MWRLLIYVLIVLGINVNCIMAVRISNFKQYCTNVDDEHFLCENFDFSSYDQIEFDWNESSSISNSDLIQFDNCNLRRFPLDFFNRFQWVVYLKINNCKLKTVKSPNLNDNLKNLDRIEEINFSNNRIETIPENFFDHFPELKTIELSQNSLKLVTMINATNLKRLFLAKNQIKTVESNAFQHLQNLYSLDLSDNLIETLHVNLFKNTPLLLSLRLHNNRISKLDTQIFATPNKLELLNLSENPLGSQQDITSDLLNLPNLNILYLANVKFRGPANVFQRLPKLEHLDLSNNQLKTLNLALLYPLKSLRELIIENNSLTELNYKDEKIFSPGFEIDLSNNNWNCSYLHQIITHFQEKNILYVVPKTRRTNEALSGKSMAGISCNGKIPAQWSDVENYAVDNDNSKSTSANSTVILLSIFVVLLLLAVICLIIRPPNSIVRLHQRQTSGRASLTNIIDD